NVHRAVKETKIDFPIAIDNDHAIWDAFDNQYWPALYVIDAQGRVRHGYAATSLDDLMAATGLGKGSLYGAFGSKRELFLRVFDEYSARAVENVSKALAGPDASAARRLRALVLAEARARASDPKRRGCLLAKATAELAAQDKAVAARALATFRAIEDQIVACIAGAQRHGDLNDRIDARRLGRALLATLRGMEALGKAGIDGAALLEH